MPKEPDKPIADAVASVNLSAKTFGTDVRYAMPLNFNLGVAGPCDGKADGVSCGFDCTCKGNEPHYGLLALEKMGFQVEIDPTKL